MENTNSKKNVVKMTTTKQVEVEVTNIQLYNDVSVTVETDFIGWVEDWAERTEDLLADELLSAAKAYEDGNTEKLTIFTEDDLTDIMLKAGFAAHLFIDDDNYWDSMARRNCIAIIQMCSRLIDVLHGHYDCLKLDTPKKEWFDSQTDPSAIF
jgi:hypothetical protein